MRFDKVNLFISGIVLSIALIALFFSHQDPVSGDFANYYFASKFLLEGKYAFSQIYDPSQFNLAVYNLGYRHLFLNYAPVPPFSLIFYLPFATMNFVWAKGIWNFLNLILFVITLFRIRDLLQPDNKIMYLLPLIFFQPVASNLLQGQSYLLILFLLTEGFIAYQKKHSWLAVSLWCIAFMLKVFPAILFLFLVFRKDWKTLAKCIVFCTGLILFSALFTGMETWVRYIKEILPRIAIGDINNTYAISYQSVQVMLKTIFIPDAMHNPDALYNQPYLYTLFIALYKGIIIALCAGISLKKNVSPIISFATWLIATMLVTGYGTVYGLMLLLIPTLILLKEIPVNKSFIFILILIFLLCNLPVYYFFHLPLFLQYPRLFLLLAFVIIWFVHFKPELNLYLLLLLIPLFIIQQKTSFNNNYFLKKEEALLIYDYEVKNDSLQIHFFDVNGPGQKMIAVDEKIKTYTSYSGHLNNLPGKLKPTTEEILKPVIINNHKVIYLSDQNRGVGFYALRYFNINE